MTEVKTAARVGIDLTAVWRGESGIVNYTIEIVRGILTLESDYRYLLYCFGEVPAEIGAQSSPSATARVFSPRNRKLWQQTILPIQVKRDRLDLMFFPGNSASLVCPCRSVATVHDLHPYVVHEAFKAVHSGEVYGSRVKSLVNRLYWRRMMKWASEKDRVIAPSGATRDDLNRVLGTPLERIDVVAEGVDLDKFSLDRAQQESMTFRARHGLPERYLLCVGTHGYKNLGGAIRALASVRKTDDPELGLVIAGRAGAVGKEIHQLVDELQLSNHVMFTGFFPADELKYLYHFAEVFLFPSFYEGFGLPVLEAFACEVPVVASKSGALPEVAGEAALFVDANDPEDIARAIIKVLQDDQLRRKMRRLGLQRAREFSWNYAARQTLEVFSSALAQ